ncbi:S-adenosyl-L-methionine-dependent methyltransferase [Aspergillus lucknowensis]|uniref:S-adenosyl-L-methionine-dependent methyltransferase n=1 Tax=Aspergillus lucknowensis TaxID=176173 RepID=A0ABR4M507_9EURO
MGEPLFFSNVSHRSSTRAPIHPPNDNNNDKETNDSLDDLLNVPNALPREPHHVYNLKLNGKLYLAPIQDYKLLDVGTGTGIWAKEFANLHPSPSVIGTGLSSIQISWVPPNIQFEVDDCCDEGLYGKDAFGFVHVRGFYGDIKPGGYIEQVEQSVVPRSDDMTTDGTLFEEWAKVSLQAGDAFGKSLRMLDESRDRRIKAGFVDVVERRFKQLGLFNRLQWEEGIDGWSMFLLTTILAWSREEVELYLTHTRKALREPRIHADQE